MGTQNTGTCAACSKMPYIIFECGFAALPDCPMADHLEVIMQRTKDLNFPILKRKRTIAGH